MKVPPKMYELKAELAQVEHEIRTDEIWLALSGLRKALELLLELKSQLELKDT